MFAKILLTASSVVSNFKSYCGNANGAESRFS